MRRVKRVYTWHVQFLFKWTIKFEQSLIQLLSTRHFALFSQPEPLNANNLQQKVLFCHLLQKMYKYIVQIVEFASSR